MIDEISTPASRRPAPSLHTIHDGDLLLNVRGASGVIEVRAVLRAPTRDGAATLALPPIQPGVARDLARALAAAASAIDGLPATVESDDAESGEA